MKVLVSAASKYGATGEIAQAIADVLAERGCQVTVLPPEKAGAVGEFDAVVLGSAVYMGQWMKPARQLAARSGDALAARRGRLPAHPQLVKPELTGAKPDSVGRFDRFAAVDGRIRLVSA